MKTKTISNISPELSDFNLLKVGYCLHPEAMIIQGKSWKSIQFPAIVSLLKHPTIGWILFDTGYAKRFNQSTAKFPNSLYRLVTPMHLCDKEQLLPQLEMLNISVDDIQMIFISHFHADHIAGLLDFPNASFICSRKGLDDFQRRKGLNGLIKGYLKDLLPLDFLTRTIFIEETKSVKLESEMRPFTIGYDLFADQSYIAIELPGHAFGHYGLLFDDGQSVNFLIADACWSEEAFRNERSPNRLTDIIMANGKDYRETLSNLSQLYRSNGEIRIYPSHCNVSYKRWLKYASAY